MGMSTNPGRSFTHTRTINRFQQYFIVLQSQPWSFCRLHIFRLRSHRSPIPFGGSGTKRNFLTHEITFGSSPDIDWPWIFAENIVSSFSCTKWDANRPRIYFDEHFGRRNWPEIEEKNDSEWGIDWWKLRFHSTHNFWLPKEETFRNVNPMCSTHTIPLQAMNESFNSPPSKATLLIQLEFQMQMCIRLWLTRDCCRGVKRIQIRADRIGRIHKCKQRLKQNDFSLFTFATWSITYTDALNAIP